MWYIYFNATSDIRTECSLGPQMRPHIRLVSKKLVSSLASFCHIWPKFASFEFWRDKKWVQYRVSTKHESKFKQKCLVGGIRCWCVTILDPMGPWWVIAIPSNCYHRYYKLKEPNDKTTLIFWLFPDNEDIEAICWGRYWLSDNDYST